MLKKVLCWMFLVLASTVYAQDKQTAAPLQPLDPSYEGSHAMVVFNHGSSLFVSNLASYDKPNNVQIIYSLEPKDPALVFLTRDADLVTIKPEPFNLERLIRGESVTVKADVYIGHFEHGGSLTYEQVEVTFSEKKYIRVLENLVEPSTVQEYDIVELSPSIRALIHQIQGAPSYDHLILLFENNSCITRVRAKNTVPDEDTLNYRLSFCGSMKSVYYDTTLYEKSL